MASITLQHNSVEALSTWTVIHYYNSSTTPVTSYYLFRNIEAGFADMTFDLSAIPSGARIQSVSFSYSTYYPFGGSVYVFIRDRNVSATNENILTALQERTGNSLGISVRYKAEPVSPSNTSYTNATCTVSNITLVINYLASSTGTLSSQNVNAGSSVTLTVIPTTNINETDTLTHSVTWTFGSHTQTQSMASGVLTKTLSIPLSWLDAIPNATQGTATCALTTYVTPSSGSAENRGTETLSFTVSAPASAAPTVTLSSSAVSSLISSSLYYQYLSAVCLTPSVTLVGGATVVSSYILGGENSRSTSSQGLVGALTTEVFQSSGMHTYTAQVIDSRGMTGTATVSVTVKAVAQPVISSFAVSRYSTINGTRTATAYGNKVWINAVFTADAADNLNTCTAYILYGKVGAGKTRVNLSPARTGMTLTNNYSVISATISTDDAWEFELYVSDKAHSVSFMSRLAAGRCNLHLSGSDYGVAIGRFSDATAQDPKFQVQYPATFYNGIYDADGYRIDASGMVTITTLLNQFTAVEAPTLHKYGRVVTLTGTLKPRSGITCSDSYQLQMFEIPAGYRPLNEIQAVCQGYSYNIWTLKVTTAGEAFFTKYRVGNNFGTTGSSAVLLFHVTWFVA